MGPSLIPFVFRGSLCLFLLAVAGWVGVISPRPVLAHFSPHAVFEAKDFQFEGPEVLSGGVMKLQLDNHGTTLHHLQLLRLDRGKTPEDFFKALEAKPEQFPSWSHFVGGPNAVVPNAQTTATVDLKPGWYVLLCLIPDKTGKPHFQQGMVKTLQVTESQKSHPAEPPAGITIGQMDFGFLVADQIRRGPATIKVHNQGTQPHELVLVQLQSGRTIKDFATDESGTTGKFIGGITGLDQGGKGLFEAEFHSGRYGLICFFPDKETGAPHFMRGMMWEFTVE